MDKLQTLSLNMCQNLDSIENLPIHVECLKLNNLSSLLALPSQIGELSDLTTLIISDCHHLVELPSAIGSLEKLSHLDVAHCGSLQELPVEVADLAYLQTLRICSCRGIKSMPTSLRSLKALEHLKVSRCTKLSSLPADLDKLPKLEKLDLSYCQRDAIFGIFAHKNKKNWKERSVLKDLSLEGCRVGDNIFDRILPNLPKKLIALDLDDTGITSLDGFFSESGSLPRGIVDLDLSNSPFLDDSNSKYHQSCLERLVHRYPCLEYIGTTNDDESSAFSLQTYFMLRFNESGRALLSDDLKPSIPMCLWPQVLSRVQNVVRHVGRNDSKRMEASILFEFLHGPVMLNRRI
jgi:Leucine-rich repeat (LRR) protein